MNRDHDSLEGTLQELLQMETDRLREEQRRDAEALRIEAERLEAERERERLLVVARSRAAAEAADAEQRAREESAHRTAMERAAQDLRLRAEIEAATESRRVEQLHAHETAMAALAMQQSRRIPVGAGLVIAVAVAAIVAIGGYALVFAPMIQASRAAVTLAHQQAVEAEARAQTARVEADAAERLAHSLTLPVVTGIAPPQGVVVVPNTNQGRTARRVPRTDPRPRPSVDPNPEVDPMGGPDPLMINDLDRRHPNRH